MGAHKGWRVRKLNGKFVGQYRVDGKYRSQSFDSAGQASEWARAQAAQVTTSAAAGVRFAYTSPSKVTDIADDYMAYLKGRGRCERHLDNVSIVLTQLQARVPDLTTDRATEHIERWIYSLPHKPSTKNKYLVTVGGMCRWAVKRRRLPFDPTGPIDTVHVGDYLRPQFTLDECRRMVRAIHDHYHLQACLMLYLGLRGGETALVRGPDIDREGRILLLRKRSGRLKRDRERIIPLPSELLDILTYHSITTSTDRVCEDASIENAQRGFDRFLKRLGIPKDGRSPHSCRHTYAGIMTATGVPTGLLRQWMGHTSEDTTHGYLKLATRYAQAVDGWPRGEPRFLTGWSEPWPRQRLLPQAQPDDLLSPRQARDVARCALMTMRQAIASGAIPVVAVGPRRVSLVRRSDVEQWARARMRDPA